MGGAGGGGEADGGDAVEELGGDFVGGVQEESFGAAFFGGFPEAVGVGALGRACDDKQIALGCEFFHGVLAESACGAEGIGGMGVGEACFESLFQFLCLGVIEGCLGEKDG